MAKKKNRKSRVSNGGRQKAHINRELNRQAKFKKKRDDGTNYVYQPNPYKKGTKKYYDEKQRRAEKNKSKKSEYATFTSIMAKLENYLSSEKEKFKKKADK